MLNVVFKIVLNDCPGQRGLQAIHPPMSSWVPATNRASRAKVTTSSLNRAHGAHRPRDCGTSRQEMRLVRAQSTLERARSRNSAQAAADGRGVVARRRAGTVHGRLCRASGASRFGVGHHVPVDAAGLRGEAVRAAIDVGEVAGFGSASPVVLQDTNNVVVWLSPHSVVAKVGLWPHSAEALGREVEVCRQLTSGGAPVGTPLANGSICPSATATETAPTSSRALAAPVIRKERSIPIAWPQRRESSAGRSLGRTRCRALDHHQ